MLGASFKTSLETRYFYVVFFEILLHGLDMTLLLCQVLNVLPVIARVHPIFFGHNGEMTGKNKCARHCLPALGQSGRRGGTTNQSHFF